MYRANIQRAGAEKKFSDYGEYLKSLEMEAYIDKFDDVALARITQLTNKSNQFNLTTKRYTLNEMEDVFADENYIKIYGRLADKFGDNGIVSVVIGRKDGNELHIDLWLMSCRVLKREMEYAMLDRLVEICRKNGINVINGYYYKTAKNAMVKDLFTDFGFEKTHENENGDRTFRMNTDGYENKNKSIKVTDNGGY
jgi:FkbH-like protein